MSSKTSMLAHSRLSVSVGLWATFQIPGCRAAGPKLRIFCCNYCDDHHDSYENTSYILSNTEMLIYPLKECWFAKKPKKAVLPGKQTYSVPLQRYPGQSWDSMVFWEVVLPYYRYHTLTDLLIFQIFTIYLLPAGYSPRAQKYLR